MSSTNRMKEDVRRLHGAGYHLIPAAETKLPAIRWRNGEVDYVKTKPTDDQLEKWLRRRPQPPGWILLCGGPRRIVCLDIEAAGVADTGAKGDRIREVLGELPDTCKRPSPSGGMHAWIHVTDTDTDAPTGQGGKLVVRIDDAMTHAATLLAELRGHGQYALILGHGRGELPETWAPHELTLAELEGILEGLREVSDTVSSDRIRKAKKDGRGPATESGARDWRKDPPKDTADVLAAAVAAGYLSWIDVLDDGWEASGVTVDGWSMWRRPSYGSPTTSVSSANGAELRGVPSLTVHSTSVPWADPETSYSPAEVLAVSGRLEIEDKDPRTRFAEAMRDVEDAATAYAHWGIKNPPFADWPGDVLRRVYELEEDRKEKDVYRGRGKYRIRQDADFEDEMLELIGTGPTSGLFVRGNDLVFVPRIGEDGYVAPPEEIGSDSPAQVRLVDGTRLVMTLGRAYWIYKLVRMRKGWKEVHVRAPASVCHGIAAAPHFLGNARIIAA